MRLNPKPTFQFMTKPLLTLLFCCLCLKVNAQIEFEKGYFITTTNERIDCLIKNVDWKNNPNEFIYKVSEEANPQTKTAREITEFKVGNHKFIKSAVQINRSSDVAGRLEGTREVKSEEEELMLRPLIEGSANLYYYEEGNLRRFFYAKENVQPKLLVYKRFRKPDNRIGENNTYKQQLWNDLKCDHISKRFIDRTSYKTSSLTNLFVAYNKCSDANWVGSETKEKKDYFNISLRPGINFSSLDVNRLDRSVSYESSVNLRIGLEFEFILPFNKDKWSLLFEPTYRNYQSTTTQNLSFSPDLIILDADYASVEFSAGIRHYSFISENSVLFYSGYMLNDMELNSSVSTLLLSRSRLEINPFSNFAVGLGYKLLGKFSLEFRYDFPREILRADPYSSDFKNFAVIFGYTFI